jgi:cytochrome b involved in lipid metabolism
MHGPKKDPDDEDIVVLRSEISRLQMLERGLARASRSFTLEEEEEAKIMQRNARMRKPISILLRLGTLVGILSVIIVIIRMGNKELAKDSGGTTSVSMEQMLAHNVEDDCWVVFHDNVYDMASYSKNHPGGPSFITNLCAQEGTGMYDAFHPMSLLKTIDRYQIGPFVTEEETNESEFYNTTQEADVPTEETAATQRTGWSN